MSEYSLIQTILKDMTKNDVKRAIFRTCANNPTLFALAAEELPDSPLKKDMQDFAYLAMRLSEIGDELNDR